MRFENFFNIWKVQLAINLLVLDRINDAKSCIYIYIQIRSHEWKISMPSPKLVFCYSYVWWIIPFGL